MRASLLLALLAFIPAAAVSATATVHEKPTISPIVDPLQPLARRLLRERMDRHAALMSRLEGAVLMLRFEDAHTTAELFLEQPVWSQAPLAMSEFNASLPPKFFVFQKQLREAAQQVSVAAAARDPAALGVGFGQLAQGCVACHAAFLPPPLKSTDVQLAH